MFKSAFLINLSNIYVDLSNSLRARLKLSGRTYSTDAIPFVVPALGPVLMEGVGFQDETREILVGFIAVAHLASIYLFNRLIQLNYLHNDFKNQLNFLPRSLG